MKGQIRKGKLLAEISAPPSSVKVSADAAAARIN
jgi:hypothetical protein